MIRTTRPQLQQETRQTTSSRGSQSRCKPLQPHSLGLSRPARWPAWKGRDSFGFAFSYLCPATVTGLTNAPRCALESSVPMAAPFQVWGTVEPRNQFGPALCAVAKSHRLGRDIAVRPVPSMVRPVVINPALCTHDSTPIRAGFGIHLPGSSCHLSILTHASARPLENPPF